MEPVQLWTGRTACALQAALRMTNESFAAHLGTAVRTVATWHQKPDRVPSAEMQQALDTQGRSKIVLAVSGGSGDWRMVIFGVSRRWANEAPVVRAVLPKTSRGHRSFVAGSSCHC